MRSPTKRQSVGEDSDRQSKRGRQDKTPTPTPTTSLIKTRQSKKQDDTNDQTKIVQILTHVQKRDSKVPTNPEGECDHLKP